MALESQAKYSSIPVDIPNAKRFKVCMEEILAGGLFAGIARTCGACGACAGRGLEFAAASPDAEGGDQLF